MAFPSMLPGRWGKKGRGGWELGQGKETLRLASTEHVSFPDAATASGEVVFSLFLPKNPGIESL